MATIDQITYRARNGSAGLLYRTATSIGDQGEGDRWRRLLEPWLRTGGQQCSAYLNFGSQAAFIRWYGEAASRADWQYALALVGTADTLTASYALELADPDLPGLAAGAGRVPLVRAEHGPKHDAIAASARSPQAGRLLVPLLAHALRDERRVTLPWPGPSLPEAVMWGLVTILDLIGDTRPVSFRTYGSGPSRDPDPAGLFVSFRPDTKHVLPPDPGFEAIAQTLAASFAADPAGLRRALAEHGVLEPADRASRISRLTDLRTPGQAGAASTEGTATLNASFDAPAPVSFANAMPAAEPARQGRHRTGDAAGPVVICPMCLHEIENWNQLDYWRWDPAEEGYREISVPPNLNQTQLDHYLHGARVCCPAPEGDTQIGPHYLPADYGSFGPPVVLGFVGLTKSGKSHLLASMVGAIVGRELEKYGIATNPLDHAWHRRFMDSWVSPLLRHGKVLPGTGERGVVEFADAFLMKSRGGPERVVALFDVAGGDLARLDETKQFLWIADGLFFVVDPERLSAQWAEDETFSNVLDVVRKRVRREPVSAAIVLNKADLVRFDEPVDRWIRSPEQAPAGGSPDPVDFLRESADVYAFLESRNALAMAEPYEVCEKATLHVASPTGGADSAEGGVYPRGVTPRRVLLPLVAMLAMTGVLTGPDAEKVGV